jgi:hypothetical protein
LPAQDEHVAILVAGPGFVTVEHQLDMCLGLLPQVPDLLDDARDLADAEILLLLLATLAGQARKVGLDQRPELCRIERTGDHERYVAGIAKPVLVERERLVGVGLRDVARLE